MRLILAQCIFHDLTFYQYHIHDIIMTRQIVFNFNNSYVDYHINSFLNEKVNYM